MINFDNVKKFFKREFIRNTNHDIEFSGGLDDIELLMTKFGECKILKIVKEADYTAIKMRGTISAKKVGLLYLLFKYDFKLINIEKGYRDEEKDYFSIEFPSSDIPLIANNGKEFFQTNIQSNFKVNIKDEKSGRKF